MLLTGKVGGGAGGRNSLCYLLNFSGNLNFPKKSMRSRELSRNIDETRISNIDKG